MKCLVEMSRLSEIRPTKRVLPRDTTGKRKRKKKASNRMNGGSEKTSKKINSKLKSIDQK